jgi:L-galactose dehydrogenase
MAPKKRKQATASSTGGSDSTNSSSSGGSCGWFSWLFQGGFSASSSSTSSSTSTSTSSTGSSALPSTFVEGFHDEEAVRAMTYRKLGDTGMTVSVLSLGASSLGGVFRGVDGDVCVDVVVQAVRSGINLIDTAPWYGQGKSERVLGRALKQVPREAVYVTTKVGRYEKEEERMFDFSARRVTRSVYESLERLGVTYIDCIQVIMKHSKEEGLVVDALVTSVLAARSKSRCT